MQIKQFILHFYDKTLFSLPKFSELKSFIWTFQKPSGAITPLELPLMAAFCCRFFTNWQRFALFIYLFYQSLGRKSSYDKTKPLFKCSICRIDALFTESAIKKHIGSIHKDDKQYIQFSSDPGQNVLNSKKCPFCEKDNFFTEDALKNHIQSNHQIKIVHEQEKKPEVPVFIGPKNKSPSNLSSYNLGQNSTQHENRRHQFLKIEQDTTLPYEKNMPNYDFTTNTIDENSVNASSATNNNSKMIKVEINENIDSRNNQLLSEVMKDTISKNIKGYS